LFGAGCVNVFVALQRFAPVIGAIAARRLTAAVIAIAARRLVRRPAR